MTPRGARPRHVSVRLAFVAALVLGVLLPPLLPAGVGPRAAAAGEDQAIVTAARYRVEPSDSRILVTVDAAATTHAPSAGTQIGYYESAVLDVQAGATSLTATAGDRSLVVSTTPGFGFVRAEVAFGRPVFDGQTFAFRLSFELRDRAGEAGAVRVSRAIVAFSLWAFGTRSGGPSSVTLEIPAGFDVGFAGEVLARSGTGAADPRVYVSGPIADPATYATFVSAEAPGAFVQRSTEAPGVPAPLPVVVRYWANDPGFGERTTTLVRRGLPAIQSAVGLEYPRIGALTVQETSSNSLGGYAGLFDRTARTIEVVSYADDFVILHESAHTWMNYTLLADRWSTEGFASLFAEIAAGKLGIPVTKPVITTTLDEGRFPLNDWGGIGREGSLREAYAYAATWKLAELIRERVGDDALRAVMREADGSATSYPPRAGAPPTTTAPTDWRRLLDLLENTSGRTVEDLFRAWVVDPTDLPLLDERDAARAAEEQLARRADAWDVPPSIREALASWDFATATDQLREAAQALDSRDARQADLAALGLREPSVLETTWVHSERDVSGLSRIDARLDGDVAAFHALDAELALPRDGLVSAGLVGVPAERERADAAVAFGDGRLDDAERMVASLRADLGTAAGRGRERLIVGAILIALILLGGGTVVYAVRRRPDVALSPDGAPDAPATLPAQEPAHDVAAPGGTEDSGRS